MTRLTKSWYSRLFETPTENINLWNQEKSDIDEIQIISTIWCVLRAHGLRSDQLQKSPGLTTHQTYASHTINIRVNSLSYNRQYLPNRFDLYNMTFSKKKPFNIYILPITKKKNPQSEKTQQQTNTKRGQYNNAKAPIKTPSEALERHCRENGAQPWPRCTTPPLLADAPSQTPDQSSQITTNSGALSSGGGVGGGGARPRRRSGGLRRQGDPANSGAAGHGGPGASAPCLRFDKAGGEGRPEPQCRTTRWYVPLASSGEQQCVYNGIMDVTGGDVSEWCPHCAVSCSWKGFVVCDLAVVRMGRFVSMLRSRYYARRTRFMS